MYEEKRKIDLSAKNKRKSGLILSALIVLLYLAQLVRG